MPTSTIKYCFDSNVFIEGHKRYRLHGPNMFVPFWNRLEQLLISQVGVITSEVMEELRAKEDEICQFLIDSKPKILSSSSARVQEFIKKIVVENPRVVDYKKLGKHNADVPVIAHAKLIGCTVVSDDFEMEWSVKKLCQKYSVPCMTILEFIIAEGL